MFFTNKILDPSVKPVVVLIILHVPWIKDLNPILVKKELQTWEKKIINIIKILHQKKRIAKSNFQCIIHTVKNI